MMKLIRRDTDYAIRAICFIVKQKEKIIPVSKLKKELKVPYPFLRRILQILNKKKILKSYKGKSGGFSLNKSKKRISVLDLIEIFQGPIRLCECFMKNHVCPDIRKCRLRKRLNKIEGFLNKEFTRIKIEDLIN